MIQNMSNPRRASTETRRCLGAASTIRLCERGLSIALGAEAMILTICGKPGAKQFYRTFFGVRPSAFVLACPERRQQILRRFRQPKNNIPCESTIAFVSL